MKNLLGTEKKKFVFVSKGTLPHNLMLLVALDVIKAAGMTPARSFRVDEYPYKGGGGRGYTLFQPLMESYLIADVYTEIKETEILISTCKPERMNLHLVKSILETNLGPTEEVKL